MAEYRSLTNRPLHLGVGGLPRALPYFRSDAEDLIRHQPLCCGAPPGPRIPLHWLDAGLGWVTKYFTDVVPYDRANRIPGRFRCQVRRADGGHCTFEIEDEPSCCAFGPCWMARGNAPFLMLSHVAQHQIRDAAMTQAPRAWATPLFDMEGCLEVWCCSPCNGSRQMMAISGWEDTFDAGWCLFFLFLGVRVRQVGDFPVVYYVPPHFFIALMTRPLLVRFNNIDESACKSCCIMSCCAMCSVAQTHRELSASGVWPGSSCGGSRPATYNIIAQEREMLKSPVKASMLL